MYNTDEEQTTLKLLVTDTYDSLNRIYSIDETEMDQWAFHIFAFKYKNQWTGYCC